MNECSKCVLLRHFGTSDAEYVAAYHARGHVYEPVLPGGPREPRDGERLLDTGTGIVWVRRGASWKVEN